MAPKLESAAQGIGGSVALELNTSARSQPSAAHSLSFSQLLSGASSAINLHAGDIAKKYGMSLPVEGSVESADVLARVAGRCVRGAEVNLLDLSSMVPELKQAEGACRYLGGQKYEGATFKALGKEIKALRQDVERLPETVIDAARYGLIDFKEGLSAIQQARAGSRDQEAFQRRVSGTHESAAGRGEASHAAESAAHFTRRIDRLESALNDVMSIVERARTEGSPTLRLSAKEKRMVVEAISEYRACAKAIDFYAERTDAPSGVYGQGPTGREAAYTGWRERQMAGKAANESFSESVGKLVTAHRSMASTREDLTRGEQ